VDQRKGGSKARKQSSDESDITDDEDIEILDFIEVEI
jgi:hypothetical protein